MNGDVPWSNNGLLVGTASVSFSSSIGDEQQQQDRRSPGTSGEEAIPDGDFLDGLDFLPEDLLDCENDDAGIVESSGGSTSAIHIPATSTKVNDRHVPSKPSRGLHSLAAASEPAETGTGDAVPHGLIANSEIGPHDVLLGRGQRSYDAEGSVLFRRLAAERKGRYLSSSNVKEKNDIARELVDYVRTELDPPGRFLRRADATGTGSRSTDKGAEATKKKKKKKKKAGDDEVREEFWCLAEDKQCLEKAKMTMRQRDYREIKNAKELERQSSTTSEDETESLRRAKSSVKGRAAGEQGTGGEKRDRLSSMCSEASTAASVTTAMSSGSIHQQTNNDATRASTCTWMPFNEPLREIASSPTAIGVQRSASSLSDGSLNKMVPIHGLEKADHALALVRHHQQRAGASTNDEDGADSLSSLGLNLFRTFAGCRLKNEDSIDASVHQEEWRYQKNRQQQKDPYAVLLNNEVPPCLSALITTLMGSNVMDATGGDDEDMYSAISQVEDDLCRIIRDPKLYLLDSGADAAASRLALVDSGRRLHGRESQVSSLMNSFQRMIGMEMSQGSSSKMDSFRPMTGSLREIVLISGYSGTGKSSLCNELYQPIMSRGGQFLSCKFDQLGQSQSLAVIFDAFNELCANILDDTREGAASVRTKIATAVQGNSDVLVGTLPNLRGILASSASCSPLLDDDELGGIESLNRFMFQFRCFVRAIAAPPHPLILCFDDLQFADSAALEFITLLASDIELSPVLLVGCYRDNEIGSDHPLRLEVKKLSSLGVNINEIHVGNLSREEVTALVADVLCLLPRQTKSLASAVHAKTDGNPIFVLHFLKSLIDERMLQYSLGERRWRWEINDIRSKDIADNIVGLFTKKMMQLDSNVQWFLRCAACLGSCCDKPTLALLTSIAGPECLDVVVREGLMMVVGSSYKFAHDKVQQSAYAMIPPNEKSSLHLSLGRLLWKTVLEGGEDGVLFSAVDQVSRGVDLITDRHEKVKFAELCLVAGEKAMTASAFARASIYLLQGSAMLDEMAWTLNYDLILRLFIKCGEAQYVTGNYDGVMITLDPVLSNGKCLMDTYDASYIILNTMGAQGRQQDTVAFGIKLLRSFGEIISADPQKEDVGKEYAKTKALLSKKSLEDIKRGPLLKDITMSAVMKILVQIFRFAYQVNQHLMALGIFRIVQLTLEHGICRESAVGFAAFAHLDTVHFGDVQQGYQYGKLSYALADRFSSNAYSASVCCLNHGMVFPLAEPIQSSLPPLKQAHTDGMRNGENEWSIILADMYSRLSLICGGGNLLTLAKEVQCLVQRMRDLNHQMEAMTLPCLQAIINLVDSSVEEPSSLSGEAMDEDTLLNKAMENQRMNVVDIIYFFRLWLSYVFCNDEDAMEMAQFCLTIQKARPFAGGNEFTRAFYLGLVAAVAARREKQEGERENYWMNVATASIGKLQQLAMNCPWNFANKVALLKAEIAYSRGDKEVAIEAFDDAISLSAKHRFVHEEALANERAAIFYSEHSDTSTGQEKYLRAYQCYERWGAVRKAADIQKLIEINSLDLQS